MFVKEELFSKFGYVVNVLSVRLVQFIKHLDLTTA